MGVTPLFDEFDQFLAELCAGFSVPCTNERRTAYRKSLGKLHEAAWSRLVEHCLSEEGPPKFPSVADLWRIHRQLKARRAPVVVPEKPVEEWKGDDWDLIANRHLFAHIRYRLAANPRAYGPVKPSRFLPGELCYSPGQAVCTETLVRYKKAWSQDMREWGVDQATGEVLVPSLDDQKRTWDDCMMRAEQEIAAYLAQAAA